MAGRVNLTRKGMGCACGRTATRWRIASGLVAAGVLPLHNSANPVRVKVAADGLVERVISGSYGDNLKPMAGCVAGWRAPRCAESIVRAWRERSVPLWAPCRASGTRPRQGGADWRQADLWWVWPRLMRARVVDCQRSSGPMGAGGLSNDSAWPGGLRTAEECPVGRACRLTDPLWFGCMLAVAVRRPIRSCCAAPESA